MNVTKAVIPAAGLGTRLRPVTDVLPKEFLPVVTKPSLYLVLEEAIRSQLKEIILIVSPEKKTFFEHLPETFPDLRFTFVIQEKALGLGHAISRAEEAVGSNPFVILLPDIIIDHKKPVARQLMEVFAQTRTTVNATERLPKDQLTLYGVYDLTAREGRLHRVRGVVEKPKPEAAPSDRAVTGRYLFTPDIFAVLKKTAPGRGGEIQLADAMDTLAKEGEMYAYDFEGVHLDIGTPLGMLRANFYFGKKEYGKSIYQGLI